MIPYLVLGLGVAGMVYFGLSWLDARRAYRNLTALDMRTAQIAEDLERERRGTKRQRFQSSFHRLGYDGDWVTLSATILVAYLTIGFVLTLVGAPTILALVVSVPAGAAGAFVIVIYQRRKRLGAFEQQLLQAVRIVAAQLEAGDTPQMAFQKAALMVEDPLRSELEAALASRVGAESLSSVITPLKDTYPSQAMTFLVAALEIDDQVGARLAPALRQAQSALERKFELAAEAVAEISQSKAEFLGLTVVIGLIAVTMLISSRDVAGGAYSSPIGIALLSAAGLNYVFGIARTLRIFKRASDGR